jgi:hypothetical protein
VVISLQMVPLSNAPTFSNINKFDPREHDERQFSSTSVKYATVLGMRARRRKRETRTQVLSALTKAGHDRLVFA